MVKTLGQISAGLLGSYVLLAKQLSLFAASFPWLINVVIITVFLSILNALFYVKP